MAVRRPSRAVASRVAVKPRASEQRMGLGIACQPQHCAEATRVPQAENLPAEDKVQVVMFGRRFGGGCQAQASRHAEVDKQMALAESEQQVLAAPPDVRERLAADMADQVGGQGIAQTLGPSRDAGHPSAQQYRETAPGHFHFGQLRHAAGLAKLLPWNHSIGWSYRRLVPQ